MKNYLVLGLLLFSQLCLGQTIDLTESRYENPNYSSQIAEARVMVEGLMEELSIPGLSITLAKKDEIIWSEGLGLANVESNLPVRIETMFRIGSISKSFTSLALGKLIEEGKISLDDKVNDLVPYFPKKEYDISILQLANHTAGIRNYKGAEFRSNSFFDSVEKAVGVFGADPLLFEPGSEYAYATYNYTLLSGAMEMVSGSTYLDYMQKVVFDPLGLDHTMADKASEEIPERATFYYKQGANWGVTPDVDNSNKWAGGGLLSNSLDMAKMAQGLLNNKLLREDTKEILWTRSSLTNGEEIAYAVGWRNTKDEKGRRIIHHGGSSMGARSFLILFPEEGWTVAMTCNISSSFNEEFAVPLAEIFLD